MARGSVYVEGLPELLRKLRTDDPIYAEPWARALRQATQLVYGRMRQRAPSKTGALRASLTVRMDARPVPLWGMVSTDLARQPSRGGSIIRALMRPKSYRPFRYPWALEASKRTQYHYATSGRLTYHWASGALTSARKLIDALLTGAVRQIEAAWGRK